VATLKLAQGDEKHVTKLQSENVKGRNHLENTGVDEWRVLKLILK
jgi:hypothetical protein